MRPLFWLLFQRFLIHVHRSFGNWMYCSTSHLSLLFCEVWLVIIFFGGLGGGGIIYYHPSPCPSFSFSTTCPHFVVFTPETLQCIHLHIIFYPDGFRLAFLTPHAFLLPHAERSCRFGKSERCWWIRTDDLDWGFSGVITGVEACRDSDRKVIPVVTVPLRSSSCITWS